MAQNIINTGASPNDGQGDPLRTAFIKTDENFDQIWNAGPVGSNITILNNTIAVSNVNGNLVLQPNATGIIQTKNTVQPWVNNINDLGTSNYRYRAAYIGLGGLDVTGTVTAGNISVTGAFMVPGDAFIGGNLTVEGDTIQVGNIVTDTLTIQLANRAGNGAQANGAGITVGANDDIATFLYDSGTDQWATDIGITAPVITTGTIASDDSSFINITTGINVDGPVDATGNVTAPYFIGDGSLLTGMYGDADVAAYLPSYSGNIGDGTGYVFGNGSQLTGLPVQYGNADVANYLPVYSGNIGDGNGYLFGNAAFLTGLPEQYGNANVADYLPTYTGNLAGSRLEISSFGNSWIIRDDTLESPAGGIWYSDIANNDEYISSSRDGYLNLQSLYANANVASEVHLEHGFARIRVNDGVSKDWTFADTGVLTTPGDVTVNGDMSTDNITVGNLSLTQNLEITKNTDTWYWNGPLMLSPAGGSWYSNPDVQEEYISSGEAGFISLQALGAGPGFQIESEVNLEHSRVRVGVYDSASTRHWDFNENGTLDVPGDILPKANATQSLGNVNLQWANLWVASNTIYIGGVPVGITGNVLTVNGEAVLSNDSNTSIATTGNVTADYFIGNGSQLTGFSTVAFTGSYNNLSNKPTIPTATSNLTNDSGFITTGNLAALTTNVTTTGNISGAYILGNGSQLTGLPASYSNANVATFLASFGSNTISTTGNITAGNFSGNITITGNVTGTSPNVTLIAGSYSTTFDNAGAATFPGNLVAGDNSTATLQYRFLSGSQSAPAANNFIGNASVVVNGGGGNYLGIGQYPFGATLNGTNVQLGQWFQSGYSNDSAPAYYPIVLNPKGGDVVVTGGGVISKATGFVNAGTFVTLDNIKATVSTSGNRSLQIATVSGSFNAYVNATYTLFASGTAGTGASITVTTTPALAINWNFTGQGDTVTYIINDTTNSRCYRITMMIGPSYNSNFISIERL